MARNRIHQACHFPEVDQWKARGSYSKLCGITSGIVIDIRLLDRHPLVNQHSNGKSPFYVGNTSSNARSIFYCYVRLLEGR